MALAERFAVEIVSVDSAQVYRGMDIGTAKPDAATRARVPHHLIDIIDPTDAYSAARFRADAIAAIAAIRARGAIADPGRRHDALLQGAAPRACRRCRAPIPAIRARIDARAAAEGWPALHAELARVDPVTAARLEPTDAQRIQRALEVHALTGQPLSELQGAREAGGGPGRTIAVALVPGGSRRAARGDRGALRRDARRGPRRRARGAARALRADARHAVDALRRLPPGVARSSTGEIDAATLRATGIAATRQLAKRQMTWLRATAGDGVRSVGAGPRGRRGRGRSCAREGRGAAPDSGIAAVQ